MQRGAGTDRTEDQGQTRGAEPPQKGDGSKLAADPTPAVAQNRQHQPS